VISAVCFAIIGFVAPDKRYIGLVRAWRALDVALARYRRGYISEEHLFEVLERCEIVATEPSRHELPLEKLDLPSPPSGAYASASSIEPKREIQAQAAVPGAA
jgi:hypothetical protein